MSTVAESAPFQLPTSWLGVGSLAIGSFALVTSEFLPVGLLPDIARSLDVMTGQAGLLMTMPGIVAAAAAPLSIAFAGHIDRRRVLLALLVALAVSNVLAATATSLTMILIGRFLLGLAVGAFWTIAGSLGPRLRPGPEGVKANAVILSGISFGTVAGVPAGAVIGDVFDWRISFWAGAGLAVVSIVAVMALLPSLPAKNRRGIRGMPGLLLRPKARIGLFAVLTIFLGHFAAYTFVTPYLNENASISGATLSLLLLINGVAGFIGNMLGGWVSSKKVSLSVIVAAGLLGGSALLLFLLGSSQVAAFVAVAVWGLGFGMVPIAMQSFLQSAARDALEDMQAMFVSVGQIAIGLGSFVGGLIVDGTGLSGAILFGSIAASLTILLMLTPAARSSQR
ncbi:putative MFS family arabinose efflux permease [Rhizobium leguminosarum]|uniref:MFS family arabinose efflux permease n=1 Tax=Rhizobium leguminosarum TaxID=384 RepID=A0AAE2SX81_RHILE|nr:MULTISPECIES: MFS transporter [Rhizobium]MBB4291507.1 putative MFS family arabinose efflux permease [Rhizobium leguminosarum]MBB4296204.1 putative MFS family arabinose efflux permease [Rhizobium leguminosarum]MBB4308537.1 putative MFS family arabinose efflux permease [Rhizobium leguminosarum]MBB4416372.1 putative MFS family arabinose efflux permease [Rhizobium leguminosarum]MBB4430661.1 putative MFS family arabinose efflux permease [Rhizobium esperanzae]